MTTYGESVEEVLELFLYGKLTENQMHACIKKIHYRENKKLIYAMKLHNIDQYKPF